MRSSFPSSMYAATLNSSQLMKQMMNVTIRNGNFRVGGGVLQDADMIKTPKTSNTELSTFYRVISYSILRRFIMAFHIPVALNSTQPI